MQNRMKEHPLSTEEIEKLLTDTPVGHLATHNADGYPYLVPVHFFYTDNVIYIHGLNRGTKLDNIKNNSKVCFETANMEGLILDDKACDVNTKYKSVIAFGNAEIIEDEQEIIKALNGVVGKYTPQLSGQTYPPEMLIATGIIKITIKDITGKYYA